MNIAQATALALALAVAGTLFGRRAWTLYRLLRSGKPAARFDDVRARARAEATVVVGQSKLLQRLLPGLMHAAIFWGFLVLFPTIVIAMTGAIRGLWLSVGGFQMGVFILEAVRRLVTAIWAIPAGFGRRIWNNAERTRRNAI